MSFSSPHDFRLGFCAKARRWLYNEETIVYPALEPFPDAGQLLDQTASGEMEMAMRGMGQDFYRIRPYEPGDSARHIDWKSSAHTGVPHIREFSRDEHGLVEIFLDRRTKAGESRLFEATVERCAYLVSHLGSGESNVLFRSQGVMMEAAEEEAFYGILRYLALVEPLIAVTSNLGTESQFRVSRVKIVFSSAPGEFQSAAWSGAVVVEPGE